MITTVVADGKKEYEFIGLLKKRAQNSDKNIVPIVSEIIENILHTIIVCHSFCGQS